MTLSVTWSAKIPYVKQEGVQSILYHVFFQSI